MKAIMLKAGVAASALGWAGLALAQEPPAAPQAAAPAADSRGPEDTDIIVTAERRETSIQRVPAAVTAVRGEALESVGITDQSQLSKLVPGLAIGAQGGNGVAFIRGIGQTQGAPNSQPGVAINLNGVYLPRESGTTPLFDMDRVEVLPGPQGTLWGRNAAGGAINFITRRPVFEFEASAALEVGNYDLVHPSAMINLPVGDEFAVRLAGDYHKRDGYLANGANDRDSYSGRLSLLWEPDDRFSALIVGSHNHEGGIGSNSVQYSETGVRGVFNPVGNIYNQTYPVTILRQDRDTYVIQGEFSYQLSDDVSLTYAPAYVDIDSNDIVQNSGTAPAVLVRTVEQQSHELRLSSSGDQRLNWVLGALWYRADHSFSSLLRPDLPVPLGSSRMTNEVDSLALFGQATYGVTDRFRLTLGGRLSTDKFDGTSRVATPPRSEAAPLIGGGKDRDSRLDWKVGVEYDVAPRSLLYANVQTGYLMGGWTQSGTLFRPATLTAYTAGARNRFLDGSLTLNLEAFYYDYKDYQLQFLQGTIFSSFNADARIFGAQIDMIAQPGDNDTFRFGVGLQNGEIRDRTNLYARDGVPVSINGYELPNAPDVTVTASWNHRFPLPGGAAIDANASTSFNSGYWMVFTHDRNTHQESFTLTDLALTYRAPGNRWSIGAFVRNLENKAVFVGANKPPPNALGAAYVNAPRTYGLRLEGSF